MTEKDLLIRLDKIIYLIKMQKSKNTFYLTHNNAKILNLDNSEFNNEEIIKFRFGGITKEALEKYKLFIKKCVQGEGKSFYITPEAAALQINISSKTKDIFLSHLLKFKKDGKNLIVKINGVYYSNFDANTIISFLFSKDFF